MFGSSNEFGIRTCICSEEGTEARGRSQWTSVVEAYGGEASRRWVQVRPDLGLSK